MLGDRNLGGLILTSKSVHPRSVFFGTDSGPNSEDFALTDPNVRIETKSSLNIPDGKGKLDQ